MTATPEKVLARFHGNPPANAVAIARCQEHLHFQLPPDYARLLEAMNGGEGFIGEQYLQLWPIEEFMKENTGTYYAEAAPGLLLFGSDGGGEAFAFDTHSNPPSIVIGSFRRDGPQHGHPRSARFRVVSAGPVSVRIAL